MPHTADTILEAWGPDLSTCFAEACIGLLAGFVEVADDVPAQERPFHIDAPDRQRLLASLLEEIIYVVDAEGLVPIRVHVDAAADRECRGAMDVVPLSAAAQVGSVPKSVSLSGLDVDESDRGWSCRAVIDL